MRVFVTGASGFIGQAVVQELLGAGHKVLGLARSDKAAESLAALGVEAHLGSLHDLDSLKQGASASDGVIHLAFNHDFADPFGSFENNCEADRLAVEAMGASLAGSNKPFVVTSGTLLLPQGRLVTEEDTPDLTFPAAAARGPTEQSALSFAPQGVRVSVMRLPPTNHGDGDHGFVPQLVTIAREKGVSAYIGDGLNRWPATHRLDTARAYRLALEKASAGSILHPVAEEGVTIKEIAETIGKKLNVPVVSKTKEEAQQHFGWLTFALMGDNPTSSTKTREQLGWSPVHASLISDLEEGTYFKE